MLLTGGKYALIASLAASPAPPAVSSVAEGDFPVLLAAIRELEKQDYLAAMKQAEEAAHAAREQDDALWEVRFLNEVAWNASHVRELETGLEAAGKSISIARAHGFRREEGDAENFFGLLSYEREDFKQAELHFLAAIRIRRDLDDTVGVASCLNNLARIHIVQRQFEMALDYLDEGLRQIQEPSDERSLQVRTHLLNNKGLVLSFEGPDAGWETVFRDAWEAAGAVGSNSLKIEVLTFAIDASSRHEKVSQLERYLAIADQLTQGPLRYKWWNNFASAKGQLRFLQGDYEGAIKVLEEALESHRETGRSGVYLQGIHRTLMLAHEALGDDRAALAHARILWQTGTKLHEQAIEDQLYRFQVQYESQEKEQEISDLRQEVRFNQLKIHNQRLQQIQTLLIVGLLTLLVVILGIAIFALSRSRAHIRRLNRNLETYQRIAAHDLKSPLANILSLTELLMESGGSMNPEEQAELCRLLQISAREGQELIENLLEFHKIHDGRLSVAPARIELDIFLKEFLSKQNHPLARKNQSVELLCASGIEVFHDPFTLDRILSNLFSNAIKFSPLGGEITLRANRTAADSSRFHVEVIDQGPGIAAAERDRLFKRFSRLSTRATGGETGTGLGLSISKNLARLMGGDLCYRETEGRGACFHLELPVTFKEARNGRRKRS